MGFLTLAGLSKRYGDVLAVDDFSLEIEKGEFVCLLGPSGCGKTSILQMVAGFVPPDRGQVTLDGVDVTHVRSNRRGLGIVFQSYALFPHMTVAQNVGFGLEMRGVAASERQERIEQTLELMHLRGFGERYPRELSGGQCQRVALARALVIQPPVLLLDEPMGALDAKLREEMGIELRALQRRVNITTLMVTHDQHEAMTLADRIVLMSQGRIKQVDRPLDMYDAPNSRFSSTFLGKANVFEGVVEDGQFVSGLQRLPVLQAAPAGAANYIVRPEKVTFTPINQGDAIVHGSISARIFLGSHWLFHVDTPIGMMQVIQTNTVMPQVQEGDAVGLTWMLESARLLRQEAR